MPHDLRVIAYDTIVAGARRHFLSEATVDMEQLATELAISRATLYRAVDSRDRLLGDVSGASQSAPTKRHVETSLAGESTRSSRSRAGSWRA